MSDYPCPGRELPDDERLACYRAGHKCPQYVAERRWTESTVSLSYRCPCCGAHGTTVCVPLEWGVLPTVPENLRSGIVLDPS
jgi:hypothetical protein